MVSYYISIVLNGDLFTFWSSYRLRMAVSHSNIPWSVENVTLLSTWLDLKHLLRREVVGVPAVFYSFEKLPVPVEDSHNKTTPIHLRINNMEEEVSTTVFNPKKKVVFLAHGLGSNYKVQWVNNSRDVFIEFHNVNVIAFDWRTNFSKLIIGTQFGLVILAEMYGEEIRNLVRRLVHEGWKSGDIYMVGHSMGAQMISFAAKYLRKKDGVRLNRITGLDPAGFIFDIKGASGRIDKTDAKFVDCIFTSTLSLRYPVCTANFYPNYYRKIQPGIKANYVRAAILSHKRGPHLYAESIFRGHKFQAQKCDVLPRKDKQSINCESMKESIALMGYPASQKLKGIFYLKTNGQFPFALDVHETEAERKKALEIKKDHQNKN